MKPHSLTAIATLFIAVHPVAASQTPAWVDNSHIPTNGTSRYGNASTHLSASLHHNRVHALVDLRWFYDTDGDVSAPHQSGLVQTFALRYIPTLTEFVDGSNILVGGLTSAGVGVLEVWTIQEPAPLVNEQTGEVTLMQRPRMSITTIWAGTASVLAKPIFATHARGESAAFIGFEESSDLMKISWLPGVPFSATIALAVTADTESLLGQVGLNRMSGVTHRDPVTSQIRYVYWISAEGMGDIIETTYLWDHDLDGVIEQHGPLDAAFAASIGYNDRVNFTELFGSSFWY